MLARIFSLALVALMVVAVSAGNQIIYDDYTTGVTHTLPNGLSTNSDNTIYTGTTKSIRIGLDWNGDAADSFSFAIGALPITVTVENDKSVCALESTGVTLNSAHPQCNYTLSWTATFTGILSITYNTGTSPVPPSAEQISIPFSSSTIVGDPQFVGLRGQSYQVHGIDGAVYNIISEANTQVNARFVFLTQGQCPVVDGVTDSNCWSHPGSYLGELSFQQVVDGKLHAALVTAGPAKKGFSMVQMDGQVVKVGESVEFGSFSLAVKSTHAVVITTEHFAFELSNSDMFVNQALRSTVPLSQLQSHGLLGQTHSSKTFASALRYIEGEVDDYVIADNDVFGDDFVYNKFQL